jgi:peroxiredoxin
MPISEYADPWATEARGFPRKAPFATAMKGLEILVAGLFIAIGVFGMLTSEPPPGDPIDLTFSAADGSTVDLNALRGKVVLLNFWATWCPPCRDEIPNIVSAYHKYHAQGFEVVGISLDQDRNSLDQFVSNNGMDWPQYFDGHGWNNSLAQRFGVHALPQMWLLDRKGRIVTKYGCSDLDGKVAALVSTP